MELSPQQDKAVKQVLEWYHSPSSSQVFKLFGVAGTGKTTLSKIIANELNVKTAFGAFTGKAALVMTKNGCTGASTIHSLIYVVVGEEKDGTPIFDINGQSLANNVDLIIIDECSMVDEALGKDLLSFKKKVLVLGDPEQLPPVKGAGFFTSGEPDVMLTEIHRQALDNPIIRISMDVRAGKRLVPGNYDDKVIVQRHRDLSSDEMVKMFIETDQLIVGMNKTRHVCNYVIRENLGFPEYVPQINDRLVCLKNNREKRLLNGGLWNVQEIINNNSTISKSLVLKSEDVENLYARVCIHNLFFEGRESEMDWKQKKSYDEFNYGYALTCHKSQGSQWNNVVLYDESKVFKDEARRWLYTGITRAAERLTILI